MFMVFVYFKFPRKSDSEKTNCGHKKKKIFFYNVSRRIIRINYSKMYYFQVKKPNEISHFTKYN